MINRNTIEKVLEAALTTGGDFAEIFVENRTNSNIILIGGQVKDSNSGIDYGVGIRIFSGFNCIYAYTNDSSEENLIKTALKAAKAIKKSTYKEEIDIISGKMIDINPIKVLPSTVAKLKKVEMLKRGYHIAKNAYDTISQVEARYSEYEQDILIANSEGLYVEDKRVRTRTDIITVATSKGQTQRGGDNIGGHRGFEIYDIYNIEDTAREAARLAHTMVNAEYCPSGKMPVIIDNGFGGVIFHEACGHGLEATSVAKNKSIFSNKIGQKIASDIVSAVDDGTLPNEWGSSNVDDEGIKTQRNLLIENGILKGYLIDRLNGRRMNSAPTGCSRRQSYRFAPTSRMSNTFILNGKSTLNEIISNTEHGLYAKRLGGGSVNTTTGDFNFVVLEGYMVENGVIVKPVKGATLVGNGGQVLHDIDMVGNNLKQAIGVCGSVSGQIPANVGQPAVRVKSMTVGGRSEK
ncbi:TldD/PmbA family protein [Clostridiaceae bacterium M8S5]|nr:TldD/PmbA family protein [Clostridiaceae bacterium M8S5]